MAQEKTSEYRRGTTKVTTPNLKAFYEFHYFVDVILGLMFTLNVQRVVMALQGTTYVKNIVRSWNITSTTRRSSLLRVWLAGFSGWVA